MHGDIPPPQQSIFISEEVDSLAVSGMLGWSTVGPGTTGGAGGPVVRVTTAEGLVSHLDRPEPLTILIQGEIDLGPTFPGFKENGRYEVSSNKSLIGLGSDAAILHGDLRLNGASNVIIRNLRFFGAPDTAIAATNGATRIWIDHNEFSSADDGAVDITRGTDFITLSWNRFSNQDKVSLVGAEDSGIEDLGHLRVTCHNNWFAGTNQRHPRVRHGRVHVFNNFFDKVTVGIGIGIEAQIVSENNYFQTSSPYYIAHAPSEVGYMRDTGSHFSTVGPNPPDDSGISWAPANYYSYPLHDTMDVPSIVISGSGVGKIQEPNPPSPATPVGLIAFYPLTEGSGTVAGDHSGFDEPLPLHLSGGATWVSGGRGISFNGETAKLQTPGAAAKLAGRITATRQFTVEIWARPKALNQTGPGRLVSYSKDALNRNFSIGHGSTIQPNRNLTFRLRNTGRGDNNGIPDMVNPAIVINSVNHYVSTFDGITMRTYRNGQLHATDPREGGLDYWDWGYPLVVGNEADSNRGWLGTIHSVALFDKALTKAEVSARFEANRAEFQSDVISSYSLWLESAFPETELSDPALAPDADAGNRGVQNMVRYALMMDHLDPRPGDVFTSSIQHDPLDGKDYFTLTYHQRKLLNDVEIVAEISSDLHHWTPLGEGAVVNIEDQGEMEIVTVRDPFPAAGSSRRFGRLRVTYLSGED